MQLKRFLSSKSCHKSIATGDMDPFPVKLLNKWINDGSLQVDQNRGLGRKIDQKELKGMETFLKTCVRYSIMILNYTHLYGIFGTRKCVCMFLIYLYILGDAYARREYGISFYASFYVEKTKSERRCVFFQMVFQEIMRFIWYTTSYIHYSFHPTHPNTLHNIHIYKSRT